MMLRAAREEIWLFRRLEQRVPWPRAQNLPQDTSSEGRLSFSRGDIEPFAVACNRGKSCVWIKIEVLAQCLVGIALLLAKFFQHQANLLGPQRALGPPNRDAQIDEALKESKQFERQCTLCGSFVVRLERAVADFVLTVLERPLRKRLVAELPLQFFGRAGIPKASLRLEDLSHLVFQIGTLRRMRIVIVTISLPVRKFRIARQHSSIAFFIFDVSSAALEVAFLFEFERKPRWRAMCPKTTANSSSVSKQSCATARSAQGVTCGL